MKVVPGLEMARKVPKIVFEIWGNFRFPLYIHDVTYLTFFSDIIDLIIGPSRSKYCEVCEVLSTEVLSTKSEITTDVFQYKLFFKKKFFFKNFFLKKIVRVH